MSITDSPRFINTPTLLEEYNADQKGYDQVIDDDVVVDLSREYDRVGGNEEFYKAIFSHVSLPDVAVVSGNEGFMASVLKGMSSVMQAVKDFFKWLFTFFTGKKEVSKRKTNSLELAINANGVSTDEIPYPPSYLNVYNKQGITDNNLGWMSGAFDDCLKAVKRVETYIKAVESKIESMTPALMERGAQGGSELNACAAELVKAGQDALGIEKLGAPHTFYGLVDIQMDKEGKLKELPDPPNTTKNPKFRTDQVQVWALLKKHQELLKAADAMMQESVKLEKVFIKRLNKDMENIRKRDQVENATFSRTVSQIQAVLRHIMANLKLTQTIVFRTVFASLAILSATTKKG